MRPTRTILGLVAAVLLLGGAAAAESGDAPAPEPAVWDDGVRPEPRALDARAGAGCAPDPSVVGDRFVAGPGAPATGIDAVCTWVAPEDDAASPSASLQ